MPCRSKFFLAVVRNREERDAWRRLSAPTERPEKARLVRCGARTHRTKAKRNLQLKKVAPGACRPPGAVGATYRRCRNPWRRQATIISEAIPGNQGTQSSAEEEGEGSPPEPGLAIDGAGHADSTARLLSMMRRPACRSPRAHFPSYSAGTGCFAFGAFAPTSMPSTLRSSSISGQ